VSSIRSKSNRGLNGRPGLPMLFAAVFVIMLCITPFFSCIEERNDVSAADPEGTIYINTVEDLINIKQNSDTQAPWFMWYYKSYVQTADLDFTKAPESLFADRGEKVRITAISGANDITFKIEYVNNPGTALFFSAYTFGNMTDYINNTHTVKVTKAESEYDGTNSTTFIAVVSSDGDKYAISLEVPVGFNGEVSKVSYLKGNFDPVISEYGIFRGSYNGNGFKIIGLETSVYSPDPGNVYGGLFAQIGIVTTIPGLVSNVSNIHLEGGSQTVISDAYLGHISVGGIAGMATDGTTVKNCYNTGTVSAWAMSRSDDDGNSVNGEVLAYAGGIVGESFAYNYDTLISGCYNTGTVTGKVTLLENYVYGVLRTYGGGISGRSYHFGDSSNPGQPLISDSYNKGTVSTYAMVLPDVTYPSNGLLQSYSGGITGRGSGLTIVSNTYNTGTLTFRSPEGSGGQGWGWDAVGISYSAVYNSYFVSFPIYGFGDANGLFTGDATVSSSSPNLFGGMNNTGYSMDELKDKTTYNSVPAGPLSLAWKWHGDDPNGMWAIDSKKNDGLPYLVALGPDGISGSDDGGDSIIMYAVLAIFAVVAVGALVYFFVIRKP